VKTGKNLLFNLLQSVSTVLFPLVTFPYASRILGPEGIGTANFADNLCRYFMLFAALGIPMYGIREIAKVSRSIRTRSKVFSEILFIHLSATLVCLLIYLSAVFFLPKLQEFRNIYLLGALYIFINAFSIEWFFSGLSEFRFIAIRTIIIRLASIFVLLLVVRDSDDVFWFFSINVLMLFANNLINIYVLRKKIFFQTSNLEIKRHLRPLFFMFLSMVAISLYALIDTLILGFLKGDLYVGYYSLSSRLNKVPLAFITGLGVVLIPTLTKAAHDKDFDTFNALIKKSTDFVIMFGVPIAIALYLYSEILVLLFSGSEFLPAEMSMKILTAVSLVIGLSNIYGLQILVPLGRDRQLLKSVTIGTVISVALNLALIPIFADRGAAVANLLSEVAVTLATGYFASKVVKLPSPFRHILFQVLAYTPLIGLCHFLKPLFQSDLIFMCTSATGMLFLFLFINIKLLKVPIATEGYLLIKQKLNLIKVDDLA
jgi:O-antigen/teichoic acid export membrane protein